MGVFGHKALAVVIGLGLAAGTLAAPASAEPGERWQMRTAMSMAGMTMPGQESTTCVPKNATAEDMPAGVPDEGNCTISNLKTSGATTRYDIACTGAEPMRGTVETTTQGKDAYTSVMTMTVDGETMTMKTTARKLGGDCDAGALRRQAEAAHAQATAQADDQLAQSCADAAERLEIALFDGTLPTLQCSAAHKARFCEKVRSQEGYTALAAGRSGPGALDKAAALCGTGAEALRVDLCRGALNGQAVDFLRAHCPAESQVLAQSVCTGRSFTSIDQRYRAFCVDAMRGAATPASSGATAAPAQAAPAAMDRAADKASDAATDAATDAVIDGGSRLIRGLFGN